MNCPKCGCICQQWVNLSNNLKNVPYYTCMGTNGCNWTSEEDVNSTIRATFPTPKNGEVVAIEWQRFNGED